jgi:ketosteroid isomerase-like protein
LTALLLGGGHDDDHVLTVRPVAPHDAGARRCVDSSTRLRQHVAVSSIKSVFAVGSGASTLEHSSASIDGQQRSYTLRATQVYRREEGEWKVAHRHADTVTG